jgi:glycosyltransferase involved in cell wall biosynthesis
MSQVQSAGVNERKHSLRESAVLFYTKTWRASGTGLFAQELAHALAAQGVRVTFLAPMCEDTSFEAPRSNLRRIRPPRELSSAASRPRRILASFARVTSSALTLLVMRARHNSYLVSISDPLVFALPIFALLRLSGARLNYVSHDPLPHAWRLPRPWQVIERMGFHAAYLLASKLIVLTPSAKQTLIDAFKIKAEKISVVEHGAFALREAPKRLVPGRNRLLVFGTLRRNKGIAEAIDGVIAARARGANVSLFVAGEPHSDDVDYWQECRTKALNAPDAVTLREGYVDNADLPGLIESTDGFLLPYRDFSSASGVAILAASNARPLIASAIGGMKSLFEEGAPGTPIAPPVDSAAVRDAVLAFVAADQDAMARACEVYRERVLEDRSWEAIARGYRRLMFETP